MSRQYNFVVYFLTNQNRNVLYIGVTNYLEQRLIQHYQASQEPRNRTFTGKYNCYFLLAFEQHLTAMDAIDREKQLKKWRREKKDALIEKYNPEMRFLNDDILGKDWEREYLLT